MVKTVKTNLQAMSQKTGEILPGDVVAFTESLRRMAVGIRGIRVKKRIEGSYTSVSLVPTTMFLVLTSLPKNEVIEMLWDGDSIADHDPVPAWDHEAPNRPWYLCLTISGLYVIDSRNVVNVNDL